jgi:4-alpha-glucanotransferase
MVAPLASAAVGSFDATAFMEPHALGSRSSGILLHPTSLPGPPYLGDIGPAARAFVDFLREAGQTWWQMLPIHPIGGGDSPYDSVSAFAGNTLLVSLDGLVEDGLLDAGELRALPHSPDRERADFTLARAERPALLRRAFARFESSRGHDLGRAYDEFLTRHSSWVWDFALYRALKERYELRSWVSWPSELRRRERDALSAAHQELRAEVTFEVFQQFLFHRHWERLREHAQRRGVKLMGDIPIYVAHDSADVWANQQMFFLDDEGNRTVQAGVPPDYFSEDGQLWGNPLYRWDRMQADGFAWWIERLRRELEKFDAVRLDHFIAFHRYWEVAVPATTARHGRYVEAPGREFLSAARAALGGLPLLAEDLGILTPEVEQLRDDFELPGMRILQFAFSPGAEAYLPHSHPARSVVYTGTHDNNTTRGWYEALLAHASLGDSHDERQRHMAHQARVELDRVRAYTGVTRAAEVTWTLIRSLMASPADLAILPMQDALDQGASRRMNVPGTAEGNWTYRLPPGSLTIELAAELAAGARVTERFERKRRP